MFIHVTRGWGPIACLAVGCAGLNFWGCAVRELPKVGAVVESCDRAEAGDVAGLQPGDVVTAWRQAGEGGTIESPFHLAMVEQTRAPYGPVELTIRRGWREHRLAVPTDRWRVHLRPVLSEEFLIRHLQAREVSDTGDIEDAVGRWRVLAAESAADGRIPDAAWFHIRAGVGLAAAGERDESVAELQAGAHIIPDPHLRAAYWERAGDDLLVTGRRQVAAFAFNSAIGILETETPESPAMAFALIQLCRSDLRSCDSEATSALKIYRDVGVDCFETAAALSNMGAVAYFRSDFDGAERGYLEALAVVRGVADGSPAECELLGNLGLAAMRRGDLDGARLLFRRDMEIAEQLGPDTPQYSHAANYLGLLSKNLGRYEDARQYYEQALRSFQATRPGGVEVAGVLANLGNVALLEGNFDAAHRYHEEALLIRERLAPDSADVAASLHNVGLVARWQGDLETARLLLEEALSLKIQFSPGSAWMANTLFELGETARADGRLEQAESYHLRALEIYQRISPRNPRTSKSLHAVGVLDLMSGRTQSAEGRWREAIAIIEEHRLGMQISVEERSRFGARYYTYYGSLARLLGDDGRAAEAWDVLERARAAGLREVVARRGARSWRYPVRALVCKKHIGTADCADRRSDRPGSIPRVRRVPCTGIKASWTRQNHNWMR